MFLLPGQEEQERWANLAMKNAAPSNTALLPAATVMVDLGKAKPEELQKVLRPIFDAAPLDRRAAFVAWLTRQDMPREALTLITAQEAGESVDAFLARTAALAEMENWTAVIETADAGGNAPLSLRLVTKARAEYALRQQAQSGAKSLADALRAGAREGSLPTIVATGDEMGGQTVVDATLVELCGDSGFADDVFRMTRDRLSRRGANEQGLLAEAHARALAAASAPQWVAAALSPGLAGPPSTPLAEARTAAAAAGHHLPGADHRMDGGCSGAAPLGAT
jgi:hypothetical protein